MLVLYFKIHCNYTVLLLHNVNAVLTTTVSHMPTSISHVSQCSLMTHHHKNSMRTVLKISVKNSKKRRKVLYPLKNSLAVKKVRPCSKMASVKEVVK